MELSTTPMPEPPAWLILPFALLLLAIALGPLTFQRVWERYYPVITGALASVTLVYYLAVIRSAAPLVHSGIEYLGFMALVGSLFVTCGGIHIRVKGEATPGINVLYLSIGAVLANILGTTGASMLLIRPWIRMNRYRVTTHHIVYFILIIGNAGGCLTPIGDPPLFLGFLKGVPFWWVLEHCWQPWLLVNGTVLAVFYWLDRKNSLRASEEVREEMTAHEDWHFDGLYNLVFIGAIVGAVFLPSGYRECVMVLAALGSWFFTPHWVREANKFDFHPIKEVAWLFAGIFLTMVPALAYLEIHSRDLGINSTMRYFWVTGSLSSVLDNAPTYLAFLASAFGGSGYDMESPVGVRAFIANHSDLLRAISIGAVFFGSLTYIGNGPNLMVKSIAEHSKVRMPSFLAYTFVHVLPVMLPILILTALLFCRSGGH